MRSKYMKFEIKDCCQGNFNYIANILIYLHSKSKVKGRSSHVVEPRCGESHFNG